MINALTSCYMYSIHTVTQKHLPTLSHNTVGYLLTFLPFLTMFVFWISFFMLSFSFIPLGQLFLNFSVYQNHREVIVKNTDAPQAF